MSKRLKIVNEDPEEGLGLSTIMDPMLAMQHGVVYVHLVVFAIDVDRVRMFVEEDGTTEWPFAWEVFLTEMHLLGSVDPEDPLHLQMLEDVITWILDQPRGVSPLGVQLAFAIYDAVARKQLPESLKPVFARWKGRPDSLVKELAPLWEEPELEAHDLATAALTVPLDPPIAPPTQVALEAMTETY